MTDELLPVLPEPELRTALGNEAFTAEQMRAYAREAIRMAPHLEGLIRKWRESSKAHVSAQMACTNKVDAEWHAGRSAQYQLCSDELEASIASARPSTPNIALPPMWPNPDGLTEYGEGERDGWNMCLGRVREMNATAAPIVDQDSGVPVTLERFDMDVDYNPFDGGPYVEARQSSSGEWVKYAALAALPGGGVDYPAEFVKRMREASEAIAAPKMSPVKQECFKAGCRAMIRALNEALTPTPPPHEADRNG